MDAKDPAKVKAGKARAEALSPEERSDIAQKAASARWGGPPPKLKATHIGEIVIGDSSIPCAVLEDGTRVLTQQGLARAIGRAGNPRKSSIWTLDEFVGAKNILPYVFKQLSESEFKPLAFRGAHGSRYVGFDANMLIVLVEAYLAARQDGVLSKNQEHIAIRCEILARGLSRVGLAGLIDEATGYQTDRAKNALALILEAFIAKELQPWVRTFPPDFYQEIFRLRGLEYPKDSVQRPRYFGVLTNDIVYKRIAPGVLKELKKLTPRNEKGRLKHRYFQLLTSNVGYPKLREHMGAVVAIMKLSNEYRDFIQKLDRLHPRYGDTVPLPLDYDENADTGRGI